MFEQLINFCNNPEDPQVNWELAQWYESRHHWAPAHTYYQRCSERSQDERVAYNALIRSALCYKQQGSRDFTAKASLENCIVLSPRRPEAYYFLSQLYELRKDWQNAYLYAHIGQEFYDTNHDNGDIPEFPGYYSFIFQKAVVGWHWGKNYECRELFQTLINKHWNDMTEEHQNLTERNITSLGCGPVEVAHTRYVPDDHRNLRHKFPRSETLVNNCSQIYQDMFTLSILDGKENGTYLEIGGGDPYHGNNTAVLEKQYGWSGVSLEWDEKLYNTYKENRPESTIYNVDALKVDYRKLLREHYEGNVVDLLQLDIEPARKTYELIDLIPWDEYKFRVVLYEHDYYVDVTRSFRDKSRQRLEELGYVMVANDMSSDGKSAFEDWWVHPDLVDPELLKKMTSIQPHVQKAKDYMLSGEEPTKKYQVFDECKCEWCVDHSFPRLWNLDGETHWFEIPKNGSASIKGKYGDAKLVTNRVDMRPIVVIDDPVDRFVSLLNDYFVIPNYHNIWGGDILSSIGLSLEDDKQVILRGILNNLDKITSDQQVHHWYPQTHFIDQKTYGDFEIIRKKDIDNRFDIEDHYNCSKKVFHKDDLSQEDLKLIRQVYSSDYEFIKRHTVVEEKKVEFYALSDQPRDTLWVVDNFYKDPDTIRNFALNEPFFEGGFGRGFIGRRSEQQYLFPGLKERFEQIMGMKVTAWESHEQNGRFQNCYSGEALVYHCDSQRWAGMIYLSPGAPYQCGTTLYAHKQTRARTFHEPGWDAAWIPEKYPADCHLDGTHFEPVDVIGNVYNRLAIFDASAIHSASEYFGTTLETGRLWHMFFFDAE